MVLRYYEGVNQSYKMRQNFNFVILKKILLREAKKTVKMDDLLSKCPLDRCEALKRIGSL